MSTDTISGRIAGAPISWGVCEVPGWGWQYRPEPVLEQMRDLGLAATEFGPDGFLPEAMADKIELLASYGLAAVGQFVPVVLHDPHHDPLPQVREALAPLAAAGASVVVIAAATGADGYDARPELDDAQWTVLLQHLDAIDREVRAAGLVAALHPHVGTMIENAAETERVLAGSTIGLCLDTGHLMIGGADPVAIATAHPERIEHVHLKDVRAELVDRVRSGELTYTEAVRRGIYAPLGQGDVDLVTIVRSLEAAGYAGWYVLEQDTVLQAEPTGDGPVRDVAASLRFLIGMGN